MSNNQANNSLSIREFVIPLQLINLQGDGFHLLVEVVVYGQNFQAVLDTGASKSAFDKEIIESLAVDDIIYMPDQHAIGLGTTTMERYVAHFPELEIGNLIIQDYEAPVFDLSAVKYAYEQLNLPPVIGVIGGDILMDYHAKIDYESLTLVLKGAN
ncbi:aspartyl protease family protein [Pedobacter puniceum]|uniref:aspartyl protease family protein n=1 Tax=Pedobacter puniceum TaxID=2666136 RepID=UPI0012AF36B1|nr:aspartyl protease family protein [Pedobacter puniceum]